MPDGLIDRSPWGPVMADFAGVLALDPQRELAICGSLSGVAALVSVSTGQTVTRLVEHPFGASCAAWSPDGRMCAVGGHDSRTRIYDREGSLIRVLELTGWVAALAWSPMSNALAVAAGRRLTLLGDVAWPEHHFEPLQSTITDLAWSENAKRIGATCYGGVHWYDPEVLGDLPHRTYPWKGSLLSLVISPTGKWACAGAQDSSIHLWKLWSGDDLSMSGYPSKIEHLAFRGDGLWMASACVEELTLWDFSGRGPKGSTPAVGRCHERHIEVMEWMPGGQILATGGADGKVVLWPSPRKQRQELAPVAVVEGAEAVASLAWLDSGSLVVGRQDGRWERLSFDASINAAIDATADARGHRQKAKSARRN